MSTKKVVLELLSGHIDVVAFDGTRRAAARRLDLEATDDAGDWAKMLRRSAVSLRTLVAEMKLESCPATVLYRSPTQAVNLPGFPVRSPGSAIEAATMSCLDALPYSALSAVCEAAVVTRDAGGETPQTHVLVAAEREDIAEAIVFLVEESGLAFATATPIDAALIGGFAGRELVDRKANRGSLYVGSHMSFFVVTQGGTLLFSRRIDLGLESLASSLTRPILLSGRAETIELDLTDARAILQRFGIPQRDDVVSEKLGLTGSQVVPLVQPVLQRFVVELRQSLRFGVSEAERTDLTIRITGPGSALRNLPELIGSELGVTTEADPAYRDAGDWSAPGAEPGELGDALRDGRLLARLNLQPRALAATRRTSRLRRWLYTGATAALMFIGVDAFRQHGRAQGARLEAEVYAAQNADLAALEATGAQLTVVVSARKSLRQTIEKEVGSAVNYRACLQELSKITPRTIRFTTVKFDRGPDATLGTVTGFAFEHADESGRTDLEPFIDGLQASPLFEDVVLGNVQMGASGPIEGQQFQATFRAVAVPRYAREVAGPIVTAEEGAAP